MIALWIYVIGGIVAAGLCLGYDLYKGEQTAATLGGMVIMGFIWPCVAVAIVFIIVLRAMKGKPL